MDLADKLSERLIEVESGCWEFTGGITPSHISRMYNVSSTAIYYIRSRQNWGWLK